MQMIGKDDILKENIKSKSIISLMLYSISTTFRVPIIKEQFNFSKST